MATRIVAVTFVSQSRAGSLQGSRRTAARAGCRGGAAESDHYIAMNRVMPLQVTGARAARDRWAFADSVQVAGVSPQSMGMLPFTLLE